MCPSSWCALVSACCFLFARSLIVIILFEHVICVHVRFPTPSPHIRHGNCIQLQLHVREEITFLISHSALAGYKTIYIICRRIRLIWYIISKASTADIKTHSVVLPIKSLFYHFCSHVRPSSHEDIIFISCFFFLLIYLLAFFFIAEQKNLLQTLPWNIMCLFNRAIAGKAEEMGKNCTSHIWRRIDPLFFFFHSLLIALLCLQTISSLPPNIVSQQQHVIVCSHLLTYPRLFHIFNFFLFALRHLTIFFVRFYCSISCAVSRHRN